MIDQKTVEETLRIGLISKFLGKPYPVGSKNIISNFRVSIADQEHYYDGGCNSYDEIIIEVQTESPIKQKRKWIRVWL